MKAKNRENLGLGYEELDILAALDYDIKEFSEYHFRINNKIDVWPSTKKWLNGHTGEKGQYDSLVELIKNRLHP